MFLVRGPIHHERTWAAWLDDARGLVPTSIAAGACCGDGDGGGAGQPAAEDAALDAILDPDDGGEADSPGAEFVDNEVEEGSSGNLADGGTAHSSGSGRGDSAAAAAERRRQRHVRRAARRRQRSLLWAPRLPGLSSSKRNHNQGIIQAQRLYNVYVHPGPFFAPYGAGHLFRGRELQRRVKVSDLSDLESPERRLSSLSLLGLNGSQCAPPPQLHISPFEARLISSTNTDMHTFSPPLVE